MTPSRSAWLFSLLLVLGCSTEMPDRTKGSMVIRESTAHYFTSGDEVILVFWEDFDESVVSRYGFNHAYSSESPHTRVNGSYTTTGGKTIQWYCETADGCSGSLAIGDEKFDLASGSLFLMSADLNGPHVVQLDVDLGGVEEFAQTLDSLSRTEPEVRKLVGR